MESTATCSFFLWEQIGCYCQKYSFLLIVDFVVRELASKAITADSMFPKRFAFFCSISPFGFIAFGSQLMVTMCKLAFVPIWTEPHLWEVFAYLGFIFANVCLRYAAGIPFLAALIVSRLCFGGFITILIAISCFYAHFKNYYPDAYIKGI